MAKNLGKQYRRQTAPTTNNHPLKREKERGRG
jgi:hypothetical protein